MNKSAYVTDESSRPVHRRSHAPVPRHEHVRVMEDDKGNTVIALDDSDDENDHDNRKTTATAPATGQVYDLCSDDNDDQYKPKSTSPKAKSVATQKNLPSNAAMPATSKRSADFQPSPIQTSKRRRVSSSTIPERTSSSGQHVIEIPDELNSSSSLNPRKLSAKPNDTTSSTDAATTNNNNINKTTHDEIIILDSDDEDDNHEKSRPVLHCTGKGDKSDPLEIESSDSESDEEIPSQRQPFSPRSQTSLSPTSIQSNHASLPSNSPKPISSLALNESNAKETSTTTNPPNQKSPPGHRTEATPRKRLSKPLSPNNHNGSLPYYAKGSMKPSFTTTTTSPVFRPDRYLTKSLGRAGSILRRNATGVTSLNRDKAWKDGASAFDNKPQQVRQGLKHSDPRHHRNSMSGKTNNSPHRATISSSSSTDNNNLHKHVQKPDSDACSSYEPLKPISDHQRLADEPATPNDKTGLDSDHASDVPLIPPSRKMSNEFDATISSSRQDESPRTMEAISADSNGHHVVTCTQKAAAIELASDDAEVTSERSITKSVASTDMELGGEGPSDETSADDAVDQHNTMKTVSTCRLPSPFQGDVSTISAHDEPTAIGNEVTFDDYNVSVSDTKIPDEKIDHCRDETEGAQEMPERLPCQADSHAGSSNEVGAGSSREAPRAILEPELEDAAATRMSDNDNSVADGAVECSDSENLGWSAYQDDKAVFSVSLDTVDCKETTAGEVVMNADVMNDNEHQNNQSLIPDIDGQNLSRNDSSVVGSELETPEAILRPRLEDMVENVSAVHHIYYRLDDTELADTCGRSSYLTGHDQSVFEASSPVREPEERATVDRHKVERTSQGDYAVSTFVAPLSAERLVSDGTEIDVSAANKTVEVDNDNHVTEIPQKSPSYGDNRSSLACDVPTEVASIKDPVRGEMKIMDLPVVDFGEYTVFKEGGAETERRFTSLSELSERAEKLKVSVDSSVTDGATYEFQLHDGSETTKICKQPQQQAHNVEMSSTLRATEVPAGEGNAEVVFGESNDDYQIVECRGAIGLRNQSGSPIQSDDAERLALGDRGTFIIETALSGSCSHGRPSKVLFANNAEGEADQCLGTETAAAGGFGCDDSKQNALIVEPTCDGMTVDSQLVDFGDTTLAQENHLPTERKYYPQSPRNLIFDTASSEVSTTIEKLRDEVVVTKDVSQGCDALQNSRCQNFETVEKREHFSLQSKLDSMNVPQTGISMEAVTVKKKRRKPDRCAQRRVYYESDVSSPSPSLVKDDLLKNSTSTCNSLERESRESEDDLASMNTIDHMCRVTLDKRTGLPIYFFTVYSVEETLFDFRVDIRQSTIPNAGHGAFLTFLGARVLKAEARQRAESAMEERDAYISDTRQPLTAESADGFGIDLKLTGDNLHGNGNCIYWPKRMLSQVNANNGKIVSDEREDNFKDPVPGGIGFLGMHTLKDYNDDPKQTFCSQYEGFGCIDLGRYGPFRKEDRKQKVDFDLKSFIFGHVPSEWCFGVEERLHGHEQFIDITDDHTGEPHQLARSAIPMYINEVGHNPILKQNVFAKEKDERTVHYYLNLSETLAKDETVELLVDYFEVYELVRERKGYGKGNMNGELKSDDHPASALIRNFAEREAIEVMVHSLSIKEIFYALDFLANRISSPIATLTTAYLEKEKADCSKPSTLQWIARRRIHWLFGIFMKQLEKLENLFELESRNMYVGELTYPYRPMIDQCKKWLDEMEWSHASVGKFMTEWERSDVEVEGTAHSFLLEIYEEVLFNVRKRLAEPLNESVWCPLARCLISKLCRVVASIKWTEPDVANANACLRGALIATSKKFITDVRVSCFDAEKGIAGAAKNLEFAHSAIGWAHSPKLPSSIGISQRINGPYMIANSGTDAGLDWVPIQSLPNSSQPVNTKWYLLWQVLYVVEIFTSEYYSGPADSILAELCTHAELSSSLLQSARKSGLSEIYGVPRPKKYRLSTTNATPKSKRSEAGAKYGNPNPKPKKTAQPDGVRKPRVNNFLFFKIVWTCLTKLGWTLDKGNRPTDYYFLPPGVQRGRGFSNRIDFFDSTTLVLNFLRNDSRWRDKEEVKECLRVLTACSDLVDDLRRRRKLPKGELKVEWLLEQLAQREEK